MWSFFIQNCSLTAFLFYIFSSLLLHRFRSPVLQESECLLLIVALALLQEAGILDMEYISILVQNHEDWETETLRIIQSLHQLRSLLNRSIAFLLARIVIHVKIHEVIVHRLVHRRILLYEIGKAQAPWAPVATHLTNHKLALSLRLLQSLVYQSSGQ